ncbi:MAG TPA: type IV pilus assembly protein PilM [bacterium]|jgi:type IV pilus assembly protein PilM
MAEKKIVGIDFTNREIRMTQVSYGRGLPKLERFAIGPIPDGVFSGGRLAEPNRLAATIKDLLKGYRFTAKRAILGISGKYGVTRMITLPKMTSAQTRDAINLQLNQYVPFPPADSLYDFKVLREVKEEEQTQQEILLVATRRSSIQPLLKVMKTAGLTLVGIKITTLSSFGLFEDIYLDNEQAVAFIDVRDTVTDISFVADNYFRLSRSIEFGLNGLVERSRQKLGITYQEAVEQLYQNPVDLMESYRPVGMGTAETGVVDTGTTPDPEAPQDPAELDRQLGLARGEETIEKQIRDAVLRAMGQFVNELMRSIRYFESQQKRRARVGKIVMFGYVGGLRGLAEYLAEQTSLDCQVITAVPGVENGLDAADEQELRGREAVLVVPAGLAVEGVKKKRVELNLVPRETMYRRKSFNAMKFAIVVVLIIAAILANLYIQRDQELQKFKDEEADLSAKIAVVKPYYDRSQEFKGHISSVKQKLSGVIRLAALQVPWPVVVDELGRCMRDSAWINEMHWDANGASWEIHGFTVGTEEFQMFLVNLWHSDILTVSKTDFDFDVGSNDEGVLGPWFGGSGAGGGFGFSDTPPSYWDASAGNEFQGMPINRRPEPMYKLPEGGGAVQEIEWYFRGHQYTSPYFYEFTFGGTVKPEVMNSGLDLFGDLGFLAGGAAPGPTGATGGGGAGMPTTPGGGGAAPPPGGDSSGDSGDDSWDE